MLFFYYVVSKHGMFLLLVILIVLTPLGGHVLCMFVAKNISEYLSNLSGEVATSTCKQCWSGGVWETVSEYKNCGYSLTKFNRVMVIAWKLCEKYTQTKMATNILVDNGSDNGLLPDGSKPLPELIWTNHRRGLVGFTWRYIHRYSYMITSISQLPMNHFTHWPWSCCWVAHGPRRVGLCVASNHVFRPRHSHSPRI